VGRAAGPPQPRDAGLAGDPAVLAVVERLPAYAPELNPVEGLWSSLKAVQLANLTGPPLAEVIVRPPGDRAHPPHAALGLFVPAPNWPVRGLTRPLTMRC
jgi:hypothetical protein